MKSMRKKPKVNTVAAAFAVQPSFDQLPDSAYVREAQLVQNPQQPGNLVPMPFSAPTLWRKVAAGTFPKPVKLSERITAWNVGAVRAWILARTLA